jgi:hypothetical protein
VPAWLVCPATNMRSMDVDTSKEGIDLTRRPITVVFLRSATPDLRNSAEADAGVICIRATQSTTP